MIQQPVVGLRDALRVIGQFDKTLRREFTKDFRKAAQPIVDDAKRRVPTEPPLSGWERNWRGAPLWTGSRERTRIKTQVDTRRSKPRLGASLMNKQVVGAVAVVAGGGKGTGRVSQGRGLAIFDMAGRGNSDVTPQGRQMITGLNDKHGKASRAMWPAAEDKLPQVTNNAEQIVRHAVNEANRLLRANPTVRVRR